jgi:uncharacterized protein
MAQDLYQYEKMVERALRGVVREALERAAREGLRGAHHFYIGFATQLPGVAIPEALRARYPEEMTIVLQHQFWNLQVDEAGGAFSVGLSFGGVPAALSIPFAAVTAFVDPEIRFGLRFKSGSAPVKPETRALAVPPAEPAATEREPEAAREAEAPQVVSLDAFRRRPPKES